LASLKMMKRLLIKKAIDMFIF